jgi:large subunit ribosomal protein L30
MTDKKIKVELVKSPIGRKPTHRKTIQGLGLKRMHQTVTLDDTPSIRGMVDQVSYLLKVEENV